MVNENIPFSKLFVLNQNGEKLGVMSKREAIELAKSSGFDLVVISTGTQMPVAKILDYGKFKYEKKKKHKETKVNQVATDNREIRLTAMIGEHDLQTKARKAREFIERGDRVKVSLKFRGREISRKELGYETLNKFFKLLEDIARIDKEPQLFAERFLDMYLTKGKNKSNVKATKEQEDESKKTDKISTEEKN